MSDETVARAQLLMLKGVLHDLPEKEREQFEFAKAEILKVLEACPNYGMLALSIVALEKTLE